MRKRGKGGKVGKGCNGWASTGRRDRALHLGYGLSVLDHEQVLLLHCEHLGAHA